MIQYVNFFLLFKRLLHKKKYIYPMQYYPQTFNMTEVVLITNSYI